MSLKSSTTRLIIDGKWFSDFLEKYKKRSILSDDLKTPEFLSQFGAKVSKSNKREDPRSRFFEAFLLRSFLYRISRKDSRYLEPFLIDGNWSNYADSWKISKHPMLHRSFRGKIAFLISENGKKKWMCHPETSDSVDKIWFEPGILSLRFVGTSIVPRYKATVCEKILERCDFKRLKSSDLETIRKETNTNPETFMAVLVSLELTTTNVAGYLIGGQGLFCDEIGKTEGFFDLEKAAKVILRRDSKRIMYITNVLLWLESQEHIEDPWVQPIGSGKSEKEQFSLVIRSTSMNAPAVVNVLRDFSKFETFLEWYPRVKLDDKMRWIRNNYVALSCHIDALSFIGAYLQQGLQPKKIFKTELKKEKFKRHVEYLLRFMDENSLIAAVNEKDLNLLRRKLTNSELIDLNPSHEILEAVPLDLKPCLSNIFVVSRLTVKDRYFKERVLETLKNDHIWKNPQGHFYYPDFRFIMSSRLGLTFSAFDRVLAYQIQNDIDFYSRLFLPILWGIRIQRQKIDESLLSVVQEPFDSISLRY